jgi:hypothetical protein
MREEAWEFQLWFDLISQFILTTVEDEHIFYCGYTVKFQ